VSDNPQQATGVLPSLHQEERCATYCKRAEQSSEECTGNRARCCKNTKQWFSRQCHAITNIKTWATRATAARERTGFVAFHDHGRWSDGWPGERGGGEVNRAALLQFIALVANGAIAAGATAIVRAALAEGTIRLAAYP
jgi:hypothetical protein